MSGRVPPEVTREREARAWELRQRCRTTRQIAHELDIDHSTVVRMLDRVEKRLLESVNADVLQVKLRQTQQLERLLSEAVSEWERSKLPVEVERTVTKATELTGQEVAPLWPETGEDEEPTGAPKPQVTLPAVEVTTTREVRGQTGNPALLAQARGALADIRAIWGLDAPQKQDVTTDGKPLNQVRIYIPDNARDLGSEGESDSGTGDPAPE